MPESHNDRQHPDPFPSEPGQDGLEGPVDVLADLDDRQAVRLALDDVALLSQIQHQSLTRCQASPELLRRQDQISLRIRFLVLRLSPYSSRLSQDDTLSLSRLRRALSL